MIPRKSEKNNIAEKCARIVVDTFCGFIERVSKAGVSFEDLFRLYDIL